MRLAVLSNEALNPAINWSALGPALLKPLSEHLGAFRVAPPPLVGGKQLGAWFRTVQPIIGADTLFWMQGSSRPELSVWGATVLGGGARRTAFVVDAWPKVLSKIGWLATIQRLKPCFVGFREGQIELTKRFPHGQFEWLPFGVDTDAFKPRPVEKDIFIYWMGRRYVPLHEAIKAYCASKDLYYRYTIRSGEIADTQQLGTLVSRSKYFVVTPPDLDNSDRTGGFSPLVMRYLEGLAAGTRLLGVLPLSGEYEDLLPVEAILQIKPDGSDLAEKLARDAANSEAQAAVDSASAIVRAEHSWVRRAEQIYARLQAD